MQIINVLFDNICDVFQLSKLVTIMIRKHTFWTNNCVTELTEILNFFVLMFVTEYLTSTSLCNRSLRLLASSIGHAHRTQSIHFRALSCWSLIETVDVLHEAIELINFLFLLLLLHHWTHLALALVLKLLLLSHLRLP